MWTYEYGLETTAAPETIWRLWTDVEHWGAWDSGLEKVELRGPFAVGAEIVMTPAGQEPVVMRVAELKEHELYVDEADLGGVVVRVVHRLEPLGGGRIRVVHRAEITGPAVDTMGPQVGPAITADFPQTVAALVRLAES